TRTRPFWTDRLWKAADAMGPNGTLDVRISDRDLTSANSSRIFRINADARRGALFNTTSSAVMLRGMLVSNSYELSAVVGAFDLRMSRVESLKRDYERASESPSDNDHAPHGLLEAVKRDFGRFSKSPSSMKAFGTAKSSGTETPNDSDKTTD